jgi:hypothetical protein
MNKNYFRKKMVYLLGTLMKLTIYVHITQKRIEMV